MKRLQAFDVLILVNLQLPPTIFISNYYFLSFGR